MLGRCFGGCCGCGRFLGLNEGRKERDEYSEEDEHNEEDDREDYD